MGARVGVMRAWRQESGVPCERLYRVVSDGRLAAARATRATDDTTMVIDRPTSDVLIF